MEVASVSWALLTFNRAGIVEQAVPYCLQQAGYPIKDLVWVDNGSEPAERAAIASSIDAHFEGIPTTKVLNPFNLGVDKGYNRAIALCSSPWIVITGCDRKMPTNWLKKMVDIVTLDPSIMCVSIYAHHIDKLPERKRGHRFTVGDINLHHAMPFGARMFHRELLEHAGYFREDFGLYGWSDVEYAERVMRVCDENQWKYVALVDDIAHHMGDEGCNEYNGMDPHEYWQFKQKEVKDPEKQKKLQWCRDNRWPYFNPFMGG